MQARAIGLEQGRSQLPQLALRAHGGQTTLLTKHGKPYAAIVSPELVQQAKRSRRFLALRGTGKGLWGARPAQAVAKLRSEWGD
jgi:antitoxin (DNA-binding transcriptional repressor) of toxin-antitoxin stability system